MRTLKREQVSAWTLARVVVLALDNIYKSGDATPKMLELRRQLSHATELFEARAESKFVKRNITRIAKDALTELEGVT